MRFPFWFAPRAHSSLLVFTMCMGTALPTMAAGSFIDLGDLPGGSEYSVATAVNADGSVVVGVSSGNRTEPFRWTQSTGMVGLGGFIGGSIHGEASGVSADGSIVVGSSQGGTQMSPGAIEAFRWTGGGGGLMGLGDLPGGRPISFAHAVSADGSVIVGAGEKVLDHSVAVRWTQGGVMEDLGNLPGDTEGVAYAVNANGTIVVGESIGLNRREAFMWTHGSGMVGLGDLAGGPVWSSAKGVNADGTLVVGSSVVADRGFGNFVHQAFIWTQSGGMVRLSESPDVLSSEAKGISADGSVVVGRRVRLVGVNGVVEAFRWTQDSGMQSLADWLTDSGVTIPAGWSIVDAAAVNTDGSVIVGTAVHDGIGKAFRAEVLAVPEPETWVMLLTGLGLVSYVARRRFLA